MPNILKKSAVPAMALAAMLGLGLAACSTPADTTTEETATDAPAESTEAEAPSGPESCAAIDVAAGMIDGAALGQCWTDSILAAGSGHLDMTSSDVTESTDFVVTPDVAAHGTTTMPGGSMEMVILDGVTYANDGTGWVVGDPAGDENQVAIAQAGDAVVGALKGEVLQGTIGACTEWTIAGETSSVALPDGTSVDAHEFTCGAPFTLSGVTIDAMTLWFTEDWQPVGSDAAATIGGQATQTTQYYTQLGEQFDIVAPA